MTTKANKFKLGLFVILGFSIGLAALIWIGASHYFERKATYVSYFQESVKGLQKGATVNYRGVGIGRVADIRLAPDGRLIEVVMNLDPNFSVDESLGIRLREQGLTGLRFLEIDTKPPGMKQFTPKIRFNPPYPVIPAYPSEIQQLKTAMETIYQKILAIDVEGISKKTNELIDEALKLVKNENWPVIISELKKSTSSFARISEKINTSAKPKDMKKIISNAKKTLEATSKISSILAERMESPGFDVALDDLAKGISAARATFQNLSESTESWNPEKIGEFSDSLRDIITKTNNVLDKAGSDLDKIGGNLQQSLIQLTRLLEDMEQLVQTMQVQPNVAVFGQPVKEPFKRK